MKIVHPTRVGIALAVLIPLNCDGPWPPPPGSGEVIMPAGDGSSLSERPARGGAAAREQPPQKQVMARVNDQPIYMDALYDLLLRSKGLEIARRLIIYELVQQEAEKQGAYVTDKEVAEQSEQTLKRMFPEVSGAGQRRRLLKEMLRTKGLCPELWEKAMRCNALSGKLAAANIEVTEEQLRAEFEDRYGRKVQIRHIQTASLQEAQSVLRRLQNGEDFAALAREVSKNPTSRNGGLLPPLGAHTSEVPPAMRKIAMEMTTPGQIEGPIQVGTGYHILKLERIIEPKEVRFEDVRDELAQAIRNRLRERAGLGLQRRLLREAVEQGRIEFVNPVLRKQSEEEPVP